MEVAADHPNANQFTEDERLRLFNYAVNAEGKMAVAAIMSAEPDTSYTLTQVATIARDAQVPHFSLAEAQTVASMERPA